MTTSAHPKPRVTDIISKFEQVDLEAYDPAVERLVQAYRDKFALGPRQPLTERAQRWRGAKYKDTIVAVYGENRNGKTLEITDAYFDGTRIGKIAFAAFAYAYRHMLETGEIDRLVHAILYSNADHWQAIIRETGDVPKILVFVHERKTDGKRAE